ncbi:MAG TPA: small multi-drug export protein [Methanospirillum sp.]|nr:small multi-drug export protein [Methanospirillum sp.]
MIIFDLKKNIEFLQSRPKIRLALLFLIPFILGFLLLFVFWVVYDSSHFFQIAGLIFLYFIPPAGKETIIPAGVALGFPWQVVCFSITYIDAISCMFMLWNFDLICRIPILGRWVFFLVQNGGMYLSKHQWVERFCFVGLTSFVFLPLQGSGAVGGSILGRMLGMNPLRIFLAIVIGSSLHSLVIGLSVYAIGEYLDLNLWYLVGVFLLIVLFTSTFSLIYYLIRKKNGSEDVKDVVQVK